MGEVPHGAGGTIEKLHHTNFTLPFSLCRAIVTVA
jgi:hypothetical protein